MRIVPSTLLTIEFIVRSGWWVFKGGWYWEQKISFSEVIAPCKKLFFSSGLPFKCCCAHSLQQNYSGPIHVFQTHGACRPPFSFLDPQLGKVWPTQPTLLAVVLFRVAASLGRFENVKYTFDCSLCPTVL